jgi:transcriptional regulator with XRE-family HTH domain
MNNRIRLIIESRNLTASKFADEIGVQASSISHILSGRNKPSLEFVQKILERYPEISYEWLISGQGTMHKEISQSESLKEVEKAKQFPENDLFTSIQEQQEGESKKAEISQEDEKEEEQKDVSNQHTINDDGEDAIKDNKEENKNPEDSSAKGMEKEKVKQVQRLESNTSKQIKKIVILYADNSFEVYENSL